MKKAARSVLLIAISAMAMGQSFVQTASAGDSSNSGKVTASPTVESVSDTLAFISWSTQNPGGTTLHYAVVRYGKDPNNLDLTAESPTRINPSHGEMVFRVRMHHLQPGTTYYYKVHSEQANGTSDPAMSGVNQFTTPPANRMSAEK